MRVTTGGIVPGGTPVDIIVDGDPVEALDGETIAATLTASGRLALRQPPSGTARGVHCGMGACYECLVTVDGRPNVRACMTLVEAGQTIVTRDTVSPFGADADSRKPADSLPEPTRRSCDVLVVGAGPAGLSAAKAAAAAGLAVVVIDERPSPGGQYYKQLAKSHVFAKPGARDRQYSGGQDLIEATRAGGAEILSGALAWGAFENKEIAVLADGRQILFLAKQIVLAPGAYERPTPFPGWTLPGVMTTGAAQTLLRAYRVLPGHDVVVAGNGPLNFQVAAELIAAGARVVAVVEAAPRPGVARLGSLVRLAALEPGLLWTGILYARRVARAGSPLLYSHALLAVEGSERVEAALVAPLGEGGRPDGRRARRFKADAVCVNTGFVPSGELARQLGCQQRFDPGTGALATLRNDRGETSVPGIFVVGDGGGLGGALAAIEQGALAGETAARNLGKAVGNTPRPAAASLRRQQSFQAALWKLFAAPPRFDEPTEASTVICRCEAIELDTIQREIQQGAISLRSLRAMTRAGMGRCQGRFCSPTLGRMLARSGGHIDPTADTFTPRVPAKPVTIGDLAIERGEWGQHARAAPPRLPVPVRAQAEPALARTDVLVIGGGVVGCSLAFYLAREGVDTCLVESGELNGQGSGTNAGSLHLQLGTHLLRESPERLRSFAPFLQLGRPALDVWRDLGRDLGVDIGFRTSGGLMLAESEADLETLRAKGELERAFDVSTELLTASEVHKLYPQFSRSIVGAALCPDEGKVDPLRASPALARSAAKTGTRIFPRTHVMDIASDGAGWRVETSNGIVLAARIACAAGPWTAQFSSFLGLPLPVTGTDLHMNVTEPAPHLLDHLIQHASRHITMKQGPTGAFLIGGGWPSRRDDGDRLVVQRDSIEGNLFVAQHILPALASLHLVRTWTGFTVVIDDEFPLIGEMPARPGVFLAVTKNYTYGPLTARLVADMMLGREPAFDVSKFSPARFVPAALSHRRTAAHG
jgi:glycine/D-amino acid oxidase-like deaminating enzyme